MLKKEKKNKIIKSIAFLLIILASSYQIYLYYNHYKDQKKTNEIITELFPNIPPNNTNNIPVTQTTNNEDNNYLGYIEISKYNIKRLITDNTNDNTLNKGFVGLLKTSASLDDETGNIIIAGHSISNVFQKLHNIQIEDEIKIVTKQNTYYYKVKEKKTIPNTDVSMFNQVHDEKILTLVTCENDDSLRLIVTAELDN